MNPAAAIRSIINTSSRLQVEAETFRRADRRSQGQPPVVVQVLVVDPPVMLAVINHLGISDGSDEFFIQFIDSFFYFEKT